MLVAQSWPDSLWPHKLQPTRFLCPWDFPGKDTRVGCHFLLQGIFLTQRSNPGLLHCRQILYWLSYKADLILFGFWLHWVFIATHRLSLVAASRDYPLLQCLGFSLWWVLLLWSTGSGVVAHRLSFSEAYGIFLEHMGSSWIRDRNPYPLH